MTCTAPATDRPPLTAEERNELLRSLLGWIGTLANRYAEGCQVDRDEFFQSLCLDVLRHAHRYDPARGKPSTWCYQRARNVYSVMTTRPASRQPPGTLVRIDWFEDPDEVFPGRPAPEPIDALADGEVRARVLAVVARLPERQRRLVVRHWGLDGKPPATLYHLRRDYGVGRDELADLLDRTLAWLRFRLRGVRPTEAG